MIKYDEIKHMESDSLSEYKKKFEVYFLDQVDESLSLLERDAVRDLWYTRKVNTLRSYLETLVSGCNRKIQDCLEKGIHDEVYEDRFRKVKKLDDLITYYIESI